MAYNKAREEYKWRQWKEAEEQKMRELGVDETIIHQLHEWDWEEFKSERRFRERQVADSSLVETNLEQNGQTDEVPMENADDFLQSIEDENLWKELMSLDKLTLQILFLKVMGASTEEIAKKLKLSSNAIYLRMKRLKEKLKKFWTEKENE